MPSGPFPDDVISSTLTGRDFVPCFSTRPLPAKVLVDRWQTTGPHGRVTGVTDGVGGIVRYVPVQEGYRTGGRSPSQKVLTGGIRVRQVRDDSLSVPSNVHLHADTRPQHVRLSGRTTATRKIVLGSRSFENQFPHWGSL